MSEYRVASRYARSIYDLAQELKQTERVYKDMLVVEKVCKENRNLVTLLKNPVVRYDYKLKILVRIFKSHVSDNTIKFFGLVCRKNRSDILMEISQLFVDIYHEEKGIVRATVTSAVLISDSLQKEFTDLVAKSTGKEVDLTAKVDESLIGGYVLRVGDNMVDNSIKNKLNTLRKNLKSRP